MSAQTNPKLSPKSVRSEQGEAWWWMGSLAVVKAGAQDTGGLMSIIEVTEAPGVEAPLHVHHREDESFWILEGDVTFRIGDEQVHARPGDYVFGPRNIPHAYTVGERGCRMLFILTPGGFENLVREMSEPAATRTLPPPGPEPGEAELEQAQLIAGEHGAEILG